MPRVCSARWIGSYFPICATSIPAIMQRLAVHDPGNAHAVDYTWGITGIAYDEAKVRARSRGAGGQLVDDVRSESGRSLRRLRHRTVRVAECHRAQRARLAR
jgi:hypothetical protein